MVYLLFFIAVYWGTVFYTRLAWRFRVVDIPNHRSMHDAPTPRGAGLIFCGFWALWLVATQPYGLPQSLLLPGLFINLAVGFYDDKSNVSAKIKFVWQILAALLFLTVLLFHYFSIKWCVILPFLVFGLVWCTNLFNFVDGTDGLASTLAILFFVPMAFILSLYPEWAHFSYPLYVLSAGLAAFLCLNAPPARVFMGDAGSCTLGFLVGAVTLVSFRVNLHVFVAALLCFLVPAMDTTLTLIRRIMARENIFEAHKLHAYQRLRQIGFSPKKILICLATLQLIFSIWGGAIAYFQTFWWTALAFSSAIFLYLCFYFLIEQKKPMY